MNSNVGAQHHLYFVLYGNHLMFFGHQTLQAPKTLAHNHIHQVSDFFYFFTISFEFTVHFMGAPKVGAATTFPFLF